MGPIRVSFRRAWLPWLGLGVLALVGLNGFGLVSIPLLPTSKDEVVFSSDLGFRPTRILAHVPGYTVFKDAYYQNGQILIYTDEPWSFPVISDMARTSKENDGESSQIRIIQVLKEKWSWDNDDQWLRTDHILEDAVGPLTNSARVIEGTTFAVMDRNFINHYYHFVGELLYPMWRIWAKAFERYQEPAEMVHHMSFMEADAGSSDVRGLDTSNRWQDRAGVNVMLLNKAFPGVQITDKPDWDIMAASGVLYRFPHLMLASRRAGHGGPSSAYKPFGDAIRLVAGTKDWWGGLQARILEGHTCDYPPPKLPVVTYLSRQTTGRRLTNESHDELVAELDRLQRDRVAEVRYEMFEDTPIPEQWARIARTTILVGVHGNGLTHIIFMPSKPESAVFELQPVKCQINDYAPLARFRGIAHYLVKNDRWCGPADCGSRGCDDGQTINAIDIEVDARILTNEIRRRLGHPPQ